MVGVTLVGIGLSTSRGISESETEVVWIVVTVEESSALDGCSENEAIKKAATITATALRWVIARFSQHLGVKAT